MADEGAGPEGGGIAGIGESIRDALARRAGRTAAKMQESRGLDADVLESDDAYLVVFDAPGAAGSDVQVRFADGAVEVRVDRFRDYYEGYEMRFPGRGLSLDGEAILPEEASVDADASTAVLTDRGTLEVELPKTDPDEDGVGVGDDAGVAADHDAGTGADHDAGADAGYDHGADAGTDGSPVDHADDGPDDSAPDDDPLSPSGSPADADPGDGDADGHDDGDHDAEAEDHDDGGHDGDHDAEAEDHDDVDDADVA